MADGRGAPVTGTVDEPWGASPAGDSHNDPAPADASANGVTSIATLNPPLTDANSEEFKTKAEEAGWGAKIPVDYEIYNQRGGNFADYMGKGVVYEWSDDFGDVAPELPELEQHLFGGEFRIRRGGNYKALEMQVTTEGPKALAPARTFPTAGLHPVMLDNVVNKCQYPEPTPIQQYTIPAVLQGNDVIAVAQTGSGKTAAYLIPVLSRLMGKAKKLCAPKARPQGPGVRAEPLVVVVVPTRELAIQVFDETRRLCYRSMLRPVVAYGGLPLGQCLDELSKGCDVLIASPGRLCDLMERPAALTMSRIKYTILDEADEMLHDDWQEELGKIMAGGDANEDADHTYLMFSATFPAPLRKLAREYMADHHYVLRVGRAGSTHKNVQQTVIYVDRDRKRDALFNLLYTSDPARTLIFCNSKAAVDQVDDFLYNRHLPTTSIHSGRSQREREDSIRAFRSGKAPILIATGISSRGWDVANIAHVINYDLPSAMHGGINEYVHRIGRTARMGHKGLATSFYNDRDEELAQALVNVLAESGSDIPEFLTHLQPEDGAAIAFDDDSDDEAEGGAGFGAAEDGDGTEAAAGETGGSVAESAWGGAATVENDGALAADADTTAAASAW
nr:hypothetical protein B0A51_02246 [Rachicladosporium sp. CCFEE 5018]